MKKNKIISIAAFLFTVAFLISCVQKDPSVQDVKSPDGLNKITFAVEQGDIYYSVTHKGKEIIAPSKLGFVFKDGSVLGKKMKIENISRNSYNETWEQPWGEKRLIENRYEEMTVNLSSGNGQKYYMNIVFRAFNDGIAFRYEIPEQELIDSFIITDELTQFALPTIDNAWWIPAYKGVYYENITQYTPVNLIDTASCPFTIKTLNGKYLTIHEANLTDYAAMNLYCTGESTLNCDLTPWSTGEKVFAKAPIKSPWRMVMIADKPGELITSYLELNLNEPCAIDDISWIEPCRYIGIWWGMHMGKYTWHMGPNHGATTENTMRYIDFAAEHGFKGVLVEGWNKGWENDWTKEGDKFSFIEPYPDFDIEKITGYASSKGVKLIGHHETGGATKNYENQLEDAFALYQKLGVNSVKTGYVSPLLDGKERHSSQYGVRHMRKVIETAAKYHITIDNHEPVMPTGLRRTYPNLMTGEGMRGQEYNAWSQDGGNPVNHTCIIPFTRGLAGPMDYTPGVFNFDNPVNPGTKVKTTLAHQLALYVVFFSPLQMACDLPENYEGNPALKFIEQVPVNWDITKVPDAEIGKYVYIVRKDRDSKDWYLGCITNEMPRETNINLGFLEKDKIYSAEIYRDGDNAHWETNPTSVSIEKITVTANDYLPVKLAPGGGIAVRFTPE
ncbi:MAG: glycoside hydrolase family 97 protein [Prolixibacteraceae bacterium]|nr:glycoside hydrolase family 97 protein [Prolixibacteraceae bacterium]